MTVLKSISGKRGKKSKEKRQWHRGDLLKANIYKRCLLEIYRSVQWSWKIKRIFKEVGKLGNITQTKKQRQNWGHLKKENWFPII